LASGVGDRPPLAGGSPTIHFGGSSSDLLDVADRLKLVLVGGKTSLGLASCFVELIAHCTIEDGSTVLF